MTLIERNWLTAPRPGQTAAASLAIDPTDFYVGGQAITFSGNIGVSGKRTITLQQNMMRPGDEWGDIDGFSRTTKKGGGFSFTYPAPSMFGICYRVVSDTYATPAVVFKA